MCNLCVYVVLLLVWFLDDYLKKKKKMCEINDSENNIIDMILQWHFLFTLILFSKKCDQILLKAKYSYS